MTDKKQKVLNYTLKSFMTYGYSSVSMDDIAHECHMSKSTLYALFPSKEDLLSQCIDIITKEISDHVSAVVTNASLSFSDKLDLFFIPVARVLSHINSAALQDIRRTAPESFEKIDNMRRNIILVNIGILIEEGKKSGYVPAEVDAKLIAHMFIGISTHIINPDVLIEFGQTADRILDSVKSIIIKGCLTDEGRQRYFEKSKGRE